MGPGVGLAADAVALSQVVLVRGLVPLQMFLEGLDEGPRDDGSALLSNLAVKNDDATVTKVHVYGAQAETFHEV